MSTTQARVEELLERWLASVDLHTRYLQLDDAAYARVEDWPKHQRPNAFVVKLARTRLLELKQHLAERRDAGDTKFAEALELMSFVTSLLGSEHIERFIPLATGKPPDTSISATVEQPRLRGSSRPTSRKPAPAQPQADRHAAPPKPAPARAATAPQITKETVSRQLVAARPRPAATAAASRAQAAAAAPPPAPVASPVTASVAAPASSAMTQQVIADAIRMLAWGREWPAVAGLIARMADRPSEAEIWKILRAHRADIMSKARRGTV